MNVVYFGSKEIHADIKRSINSLLTHTQANVYVLADAPIEVNAEVIDISNQPWFDPNGPNYHTKWKMFGLIRAAFTKIFPFDNVLSLDADTIIQDDISELDDIDLEDYYFAAVKEPYLSMLTPYYNTGVCLMNLKQLRTIDDQLIDSLNTQRYRYVSQDALNQLGKIKDLPSIYNACKFTAHADNPKILHFADMTNWRGLPEVKRWDV